MREIFSGITGVRNIIHIVRDLTPAVEASFKHLYGKIVMENSDPIIGNHTGPGTVELLFLGNNTNLKSKVEIRFPCL